MSRTRQSCGHTEVEGRSTVSAIIRDVLRVCLPFRVQVHHYNEIADIYYSSVHRDCSLLHSGKGIVVANAIGRRPLLRALLVEYYIRKLLANSNWTGTDANQWFDASYSCLIEQ